MSNPTPTADFSQLSERLRRLSLSTPAETESQEAIWEMSLAELSRCTIDFGHTHVGKTYAEMTKDPKYLQWFSSRYKDSKVSSHVKFLRFIQLHVDKLEKDAESGKTKDKSAPKSKPKAKPAACSVVNSPTSILDEEDVDLEESWANLTSVSQAEMMTVHNRMAELEVAMQQVLAHLTQQQQERAQQNQ